MISGKEATLEMKENQFQAEFIRELKREFPGCVVLKNDANYLQGFPDLLLLYNSHWAALECKRSEDASHRPNQDYYIQKLGEMSYARFVHPENKSEVLNELQQAFGSCRTARISGSE